MRRSFYQSAMLHTLELLKEYVIEAEEKTWKDVKMNINSDQRPPVKIIGLPLYCDVCNKSFKAGRDLLKHMSKEHKLEAHEKQDCDNCLVPQMNY